MVKFFLLTSEQSERDLWDYPERVIDVHTPIFKEACLIEQYKVLDVKFLVVYEHGDRIYYQSDWKSYNILEAMFDSGSLTPGENVWNLASIDSRYSIFHQFLIIL